MILVDEIEHTLLYYYWLIKAFLIDNQIMPIMDKKEADMLMESLALCFKNSWTKERSVSYVRKKYGRLFKEDIIKRGFDILTKNKIRDPKYGEVCSFLLMLIFDKSHHL